MHPNVATAFLNNPKTKEQFDTRRVDLGKIDPQDLENGAVYLGRLKKTGIDLYQYEEYYVDDVTDPENPTVESMVPENVITLVSTNGKFGREYGAVTKGDPETKKFVTVEDTRVPDSWMEKNPDQRFLKVSSKPLVYPGQVNGWFIGEVI